MWKSPKKLLPVAMIVEGACTMCFETLPENVGVIEATITVNTTCCGSLAAIA